MNTVAGNEAIVLDGASRYPGITFYGLNPGMVKTDIRSHFLGKGSLRHRLVESFVGLLWGGPDEYAEKTGPLLVSPDIQQFSGSMFNKFGEAIEPSPGLTDRAYVLKFMEALERLSKRAFAHVNGCHSPRHGD
jgi:hypothetical protein